MSLQVCIDDPADLQIKRPMTRIRGWYAADSAEDLTDLQFCLAGRRLAYRAVHRPDVEGLLPEKVARGFLLDLDLSQHLPGIQKREFILEVLAADGRAEGIRFRVAGEALRKCLEAASGA